MSAIVAFSYHKASDASEKDGVALVLSLAVTCRYSAFRDRSGSTDDARRAGL